MNIQSRNKTTTWMYKFCYTSGMSVQDFEHASSFTGIQWRKYIEIVYIIHY